MRAKFDSYRILFFVQAKALTDTEDITQVPFENEKF